MRLVVAPFAVEDIAVDVVENTTTVRLIVAPFTFVASAVWPFLLTKTMTESAKPLALVDSSILKRVFTFFALQIATFLA